MTGTSDKDLVEFLSDPDNAQKFLAVGLTMSLGYDFDDNGNLILNN
jgi:hypothetical protein